MDIGTRILYEDNHIIVINKWPGVLVHATDPGEQSLMDHVKEFIKVRDHKEGNVFLGLIHRLDRLVSGIIIFGKTSKGASRLSEQFREHAVTKVYHAWVEGKVSIPKKKVEIHIKKDENTRKANVVSEHTLGAQYSALTYEVVKQDTYQKIPVTLIKVTLHTGRYNQIRATMSHLGHPILGDVKYGARTTYKEGIALRSTYCKFKKATLEEDVVLSLPFPEL